MFYKALMLLALGSLSAHGASVCPATAPAGAWGLEYQVSASQSGAEPRQVQLLRRGAQTALYSPEHQMAEWWHFEDPKRPGFSRVFDQQQRRIDYYMGDLRALGVQAQQEEVESFAARHLLGQLTKQGSSPCEHAERYQGEINGVSYDLLWSPVLAAPLAIVTRKGEVERRWQADKLLGKDAVNARFATWQRYRETDFADIGDMENDPFLAKMINQGFIEHREHAVYNDQGQPLATGHSH
ncbi:hypothetical protein [Gallaecimonas pentaromativorans]|uniref:Uncharacterized protein n=1 Tax=Gallaecimonas pentaromativorans TaxID=584787 RepID=A0A3N1NS22_9GAMM|nr:hypothetical protein [Gallaecimonas pentaromativorans]ROQ18933.1 hypothetical protein EDC28_11349 [Gallaecimonas pentaromativorans]